MILIVNTANLNQTAIALSCDDFIIAKNNFKSKYNEAEKLLPEIAKLIKESKKGLADLRGVIVVNGPGGFSALRIGVAVANAMAYALKIPVASVKLSEFNNLKELIEIGETRLKKIKRLQIVEPFYGKEPNITTSDDK